MVALCSTKRANSRRAAREVRELGVEPLIDELATKKASLFPDDLRQLLDVVVTRDPTCGRYVQVLSAT